MIGDPIPEVQWWFIEAEEHNETYTQLYDGAWDERVHINATYIAHATSTIHIATLALNDSGTYECRASNDPDRNELKRTPRIKWIRSQANLIVIQRERLNSVPTPMPPRCPQKVIRSPPIMKPPSAPVRFDSKESAHLGEGEMIIKTDQAAPSPCPKWESCL